MPAGNDDFGSTDEVRIYKDEGEDDVQRASENLSEDKIGLVTETEKRVDACGISQSMASAGATGSNLMPNWTQNANTTAASFYSSLLNSSYNGFLQQYHLQQLVNGLMSAPPASSSSVLDTKRVREREREDSISSPALSPLTVPGCSSPMLSVLAAAMSGALSPGTPSPRCVTPNQTSSNSAFRSVGVNSALGSAWPFGVGVGVGMPMSVGVGVNMQAANASNLMPPPASPFPFAAGSTSVSPSASGAPNPALVAAMLNKMQHAAAANMLAVPNASRLATSNSFSPASASASGSNSLATSREHERRAQDAAGRLVTGNHSARPASDSHGPSLSNSAQGGRDSEGRTKSEVDVKPPVATATHNGHKQSQTANGQQACRKRPLESSAELSRRPAGDVKDAATVGDGQLSQGDDTRNDSEDMEDDSEMDDDDDDSVENSMGVNFSGDCDGDGDGDAQSSSRPTEGAGGSGSTTSSAAARRWVNVKKPLNAFMLFMKEQRAAVMGESTLKESAAINQLLGRKWHALDKSEQEKYYALARHVKEEHARLYPGWSARDNYAQHSRRKKRRLLSTFAQPAAADRLGAAVGAVDLQAAGRDCASPKKCRARFGLENQKDWCKPCRRKKKCIRFAAETERALGAGASNSKRSGPGPVPGTGPDARTPDLFSGMLKPPFSFGGDFSLAQSGQFPFSFPINVEAYLQMAGGSAAYRFPFGPPPPPLAHPGLSPYSQSLNADRLAAAALGAVRNSGTVGAQPASHGHGHSHSHNRNLPLPSEIGAASASPNADAGRLRRSSSVASSRGATLRRGEAECNNLVSESDEDEARAGHAQNIDVDGDAEEKPVARTAAENEKDAAFAFDDEPNLSPLSVDEDDTAMLRNGTLIASSPRGANTSEFDAHGTVRLANGSNNASVQLHSSVSAVGVTTKRQDADSRNNNARPASASDSTADSVPIAADAGAAARATDAVSVDDLRQHSADRLRLVGVVECNAVG